MRKMIFALVTMLTMSLSASAMSYEQARNEALFLTDKMAYELNLTDAQYEAAYEINLDYLMSVASYDDVLGINWERRNADLRFILYSWQWDLFRAATYFYRPLYWERGYWHFAVYTRYPQRDYFYFGRPHFYATYRGGHAWHRNGGRSYYEHHTNHFRPELSHGRSHFGMRNSYDRGDYRGSRAGSSTRVTERRGDMNHNNRSGDMNRNNRSGDMNHNNRSGDMNRNNHSGDMNRNNRSGDMNRSGNFNRNSTVIGSTTHNGSMSGNNSGMSRGNMGSSRPATSAGSSRPATSAGNSRPATSAGSNHSNGGSHNSGGGHFSRSRR